MLDRAAQGGLKWAFAHHCVSAPGEGGRACQGRGRVDRSPQRVLKGASCMDRDRVWGTC